MSAARGVRGGCAARALRNRAVGDGRAGAPAASSTRARRSVTDRVPVRPHLCSVLDYLTATTTYCVHAIKEIKHHYCKVN